MGTALAFRMERRSTKSKTHRSPGVGQEVCIAEFGEEACPRGFPRKTRNLELNQGGRRCQGDLRDVAKLEESEPGFARREPSWQSRHQLYCQAHHRSQSRFRQSLCTR